MERLNHIVTVFDVSYLKTIGCATVILTDNDILGNIDKPPRQIT